MNTTKKAPPIDRCLGCGAFCRTLYCDGCAPPLVVRPADDLGSPCNDASARPYDYTPDMKSALWRRRHRGSHATS